MIFPFKRTDVYHSWWGDFPLPSWTTLEGYSFFWSPGGAAHPEWFGALRGQAYRLQGLSRHNDCKDGRARHQRGPQRDLRKIMAHTHMHMHTHRNLICSLMMIYEVLWKVVSRKLNLLSHGVNTTAQLLIDLFPDALHHRRPTWVEMTLQKYQVTSQDLLFRGVFPARNGLPISFQ